MVFKKWSLLVAEPNYQTLSACGGGNVFGEDKAGANKDHQKPNKQGAAGVADPNYQTLAACGGGNVFGADKAAANKDHKKPYKQGQVRPADPNYQTLAGMNADCFKK